MSSSGTSKTKVKSKFGEKMLSKMGWKGAGLGKNQDGVSDCVQIKRRDEGKGLGKEEKKRFQWDNAFWENTFNDVAKKLKDDFPGKSSKSKAIKKKKKSKKDKKEKKSKRKQHASKLLTQESLPAEN